MNSMFNMVCAVVTELRDFKAFPLPRLDGRQISAELSGGAEYLGNYGKGSDSGYAEGMVKPLHLQIIVLPCSVFFVLPDFIMSCILLDIASRKYIPRAAIRR